MREMTCPNRLSEERVLSDNRHGVQNPFDRTDSDSKGGDGISNADEIEQGTDPIVQVPTWSLVGIIAAVTAIVVVGYLVTRRRRDKS